MPAASAPRKLSKEIQKAIEEELRAHLEAAIAARMEMRKTMSRKDAILSSTPDLDSMHILRSSHIFEKYLGIPVEEQHIKDLRRKDTVEAIVAGLVPAMMADAVQSGAAVWADE